MNKIFLHDGCHIEDCKRFFEWWYFDFDLENDYSLHIEWQSPVFNMRDDYCMLITRLYNHETASDQSFHPIFKAYRYPRKSIRQDRSSCNIVFPSGFIIEDKEEFHIRFKEKDLCADIKLKRLLPPLSVENEVLLEVDNQEFFAWNIPLPRASASGNIQAERKKIEMNGIAYHDHNWGNLNIGRYLESWIWTRVQFQHFTLILGDIFVRGRKAPDRSLLFVDEVGNKLTFSDLEIDYSFSLDRTNGRMSTPESIRINFGHHQKYYKIKISILTSIPIQEAPISAFESHQLNTLISKFYYLFKLYHLPDSLRKWIGRLFYFQAVIAAELEIDNKPVDIKNGRLETFSFDD